jgi:hypothetical protein
VGHPAGSADRAREGVGWQRFKPEGLI